MENETREIHAHLEVKLRSYPTPADRVTPTGKVLEKLENAIAEYLIVEFGLYPLHIHLIEVSQDSVL